MSEPNPAVATLQAQYLASMQEASECRSTAAQFEARAASADATAGSLEAAIVALGGDVPVFPPEPDPDEAMLSSTPHPISDAPPEPEEGSAPAEGTP